MLEMMARSDFRHDATVGLMRGDLRSDFTGEQFATAQNRDGGFVARCLDGEERIGGRGPAAERLRLLRRHLLWRRLLLHRVAFRRGLLRVNHHAFERVDPRIICRSFDLIMLFASADGILSLLRNAATARSCSVESGTRMFGTTPLPWITVLLGV